MKKIHVIGLMLFAAFVCSAAMASAATAAEVPQWLVSGATIALGTTVNADIEFEAGSLLLLEDMKAPGTPDILCEVVEALSLLLPNGEDEQVTGKCVKAVDDKSTCAAGSITVEPLHLPWKTAVLEPTVGVFEDDITAGTGGEPSYKIECTVLGIKVTDTCTTTKGKTLLTNLEDGLIHVEFMEEIAKEEEANCSLGGKEEGLVVGLLFLHALSTSGELLTLAVSLAPEV